MIRTFILHKGAADTLQILFRIALRSGLHRVRSQNFVNHMTDGAMRPVEGVGIHGYPKFVAQQTKRNEN